MSDYIARGVQSRPIRGHAVRWGRNTAQLNAVLRFSDDDWEERPVPGERVAIEQDDGDVIINPGDWVVSEFGPYGRIYALTNAEFEARYVLADDGEYQRTVPHWISVLSPQEPTERMNGE